MTLAINECNKIYTLQEDFNTMFPFLKVEFYTKFRNQNGLSSNLLNNKSLCDARTIHTETALVITPQTTVVELETQFLEIYGLIIQVFRKSGKVWLETTITDSWTLEEQNKQGEDLSKSVK